MNTRKAMTMEESGKLHKAAVDNYLKQVEEILIAHELPPITSEKWEVVTEDNHWQQMMRNALSDVEQEDYSDHEEFLRWWIPDMKTALKKRLKIREILQEMEDFEISLGELGN